MAKTLRIKYNYPMEYNLDEVTFDEKIHLSLSEPEKIWSLKDFGYGPQTIADSPFDVAVTTPFRILSPKGVEALNQSIQQLLTMKRSSERIANFIRGAYFYSSFIRDLMSCPALNDHISKLSGAKALPHPMALYQAHINLKPEEETQDVDKWHTDTVVLDFVLLCTDPQKFTGGHFEYFKCTRGQAIRGLIRDEDKEIIKVQFPEAGYAVLQQGNLVVHRASAVTKGTERTTLVQSFISNDAEFKDISKLSDCRPVDPPEILFSEWARYKAFLSERKLRKLMQELPNTEDKNQICLELRKAIRDVEEAILEISDPNEHRLHFLEGDVLTDLL
ncbi:MAG: hypothetical protein NXH75_02990 [Halobacteriovoraceae bacterium]|nr:hypothetical protein [Halobacteriovoraceae bacterium]